MALSQSQSPDTHIGVTSIKGLFSTLRATDYRGSVPVATDRFGRDV
jgi:hypothetical protein